LGTDIPVYSYKDAASLSDVPNAVPHLAAWIDGSFVAGWLSKSGFLGQRFSNTGAPLGGVTTMLAPSDLSDVYDSVITIARLNNQHIVLGWVKLTPFGIDSPYVMDFSSDLQTRSDSTLLMDASEDKMAPLLIAPANGSAIEVVWHSALNDHDVFGQHMELKPVFKVGSVFESVDESVGKVVVTVTRDDASSAGSVSFATQDDTAHAPNDYQSVSGTLHFDPGVHSIPVIINLNDDGYKQPTSRSFRFALSNPTGGAVLGRADSEQFLISDIFDTLPATLVAFPTDAVAFYENAGVVNVEVKRFGDLSHAATVHFTTADYTAVAPTDYTAKSGTVSFKAGELSKTIPVALINRPGPVSNWPRGFALRLDSVTGEGQTLGRSGIVVYIYDVAGGGGGSSLTTIQNATALKSGGKLSAVVLNVSGALNAAQAKAAGAYKLMTAGLDKTLGTKDDIVVKIKNATYNKSTRTIKLTLAAPAALGDGVRLRVFADKLRDAKNKKLDGNQDGVAGGDYVKDLM
jgi:hypothetical protein